MNNTIKTLVFNLLKSYWFISKTANEIKGSEWWYKMIALKKWCTLTNNISGTSYNKNMNRKYIDISWRTYLQEGKKYIKNVF